VREILPGPANDALVVAGDDGEILLPFTRDAVVRVDTPARRVVLRDGLL
jgi:ribosomal 30S subunit maturation factor RimM